MAFYASGFTTFGAYKKIGGENIEAQPIEPTGAITVDAAGDVTAFPQAAALTDAIDFGTAGFIILEGEGQGDEIAIPIFKVTRA